MEALMLLGFYLLGVLTGAIGIVTLTLNIGRNAQSKTTNVKKLESVTERLKKVRDLMGKQIELQGQISGPQKNSLHGKYKNGLIGRVKELEEEKFEILKSIITDGFDPEISIMDETGVVSSIKLSAFLANAGVVMDPKASVSKEIKPANRFTIHKGGKNDDETTH